MFCVNVSVYAAVSASFPLSSMSVSVFAFASVSLSLCRVACVYGCVHLLPCACVCMCACVCVCVCVFECVFLARVFVFVMWGVCTCVQGRGCCHVAVSRLCACL